MFGFFRANLANAITGIGIILTVWLNFIIWAGPVDFFPVFVLSVLIGLTDLFDGWTARRLKTENQVGASLDRLRDKFFACSIFLYFLKQLWTLSGKIWVLLIKGLIITLLSIEIVLFIFWLYGFLKGMDIRSNLAGRVKMALYFLAIGWWFLFKWLEQITGFDFELAICAGIIGLMFAAGIYGILSTVGYLERVYEEYEE